MPGVEAVKEFRVMTHQFSSEFGRGTGAVINAVSKSGTNAFAGSVGGYFRNDKFNAKDFITDRVLPYSNQQVSTTFGGPIRRDRIHFFGAYGYEREPATYYYTSQYPSFNVDVEFPRRVHTMMGRVDYQFTSQTRLSVRVSGYNNLFYAGGGAVTHPSVGGTRKRVAPQYNGTLTQVLGSRAVNELRVGATDYERQDQPNVQWKGGAFPFSPVLSGSPPRVTAMSFAIMIVTIVINTFVTIYEQRRGLKLGSPILIADSLHTRSDIYASLAVLVGLAGVKAGRPILDPLAAIVVVGLIARAGYRIVTSSLDVLADAVVYSPQEIAATAMQVPGVLDCHDVRTRGLPDHVHLDFHLTIAPDTPTSESHAIAHRVIEMIRLRFPGIQDVTPHVEPPGAVEVIDHLSGHGQAGCRSGSPGKELP